MRRVLQGVIGPELFQKAAIPGAVVVSGNDAVEGSFFGSVAGQSDFYCHACSPLKWQHAATQPAHAAFIDFLHHFHHLRIIFEQAVNILNTRTAAGGNAFAAAAVDNRVLAALLGRHGIDDGLDVHQLLLVHLQVLHLLDLTHAGNHAQNIGKRSHFADLPHLIPKILQGKLILAQLLFELDGLFLIHHLLGLLDHGEDIPHAENPRGHPVGMECFQVAELFTDADEFDRLAGNRPNRQGRAATGVAVHFGEHHAADVQAFVKGLGDVHRVLTGHGIGHQQDVGGLCRRADARELTHQRLIDMQTAGRIEQQCIAACLLGSHTGLLADRDRIHVRGGIEHRHAQLDTQLFELVDGRRPIDVRRNQIGLLAGLAQHHGQLPGRGGLTGTLKSHQHHRDRLFPLQLEPLVGVAHELGQRFVDNLDHLLARRQATHDLLAQRARLDLGHQLLDHLEVDIGFQKGHADLAQAIGNVLLGKLALPFELLEDRIQFVA
ncbi:hypothetical protein DESC_870022 [Desulfosarcina cetonica]|nr:hypothetical protein DESC_870022 [Desulfosarcina cetonica]